MTTIPPTGIDPGEARPRLARRKRQGRRSRQARGGLGVILASLALSAQAQAASDVVAGVGLGTPAAAVPSFSPLSALGGGVMIGLAAALLLLLTGRVAGISGILGGIVDEPGQRRWCAAFAVGLLAGGVGLRLAAPALLAITTDTSLATTAVAGALVGLGTQLGSGCTSGHGVCGLGRGSRRSLAAVATFMASGAATVFVANHLWG